jgi:RNA recognition motif-containing protein
MDSDNWRIKRDPTSSPSTPRDWGFNRSSQQRRPNTHDRNGSNDRPQFSHTGFGNTHRKPLDDAKAEKAIDEGRRVYVGNMPYQATIHDVEKLFSEVASGIEGISMSVDPLTGRNPSYCFIDFTSSDLAQSVMEGYSGRDIMGRALKVKPGVRSTTSASRQAMIEKSPLSRREVNPLYQDRWRTVEDLEKVNKAGEEGRRLYVGGLPRFKDQFITNLKVRELFQGFNVLIVGKLISPHESKRDELGNHHYCFVDLATAEEAVEAMRSLDGMRKFSGHVKVDRSFGTSRKLAERRSLYVGGLPEFESQEALEAAMRKLFGGYAINNISKLFSPAVPKNEEGNRMFCFVELANGEQADAAIAELDVSVSTLELEPLLTVS